jgi:hypothetical protein
MVWTAAHPVYVSFVKRYQIPMGVTSNVREGRGEAALRQTPTDAAYGVVYLLSDESSQVTGTEVCLTVTVQIKFAQKRLDRGPVPCRWQ